MTHFEDSLKPRILNWKVSHMTHASSSEPRQVLRWMNSSKWTLARPLPILWTCFRVCFCSVRGGCSVVVAPWYGHQALACSLPMYLFPDRTDAGLRHTLLRSSVTRDPWSGRLPVSSLLSGTFSDAWTPNVAGRLKRVWQAGQSHPCPRPSANHQQLCHASHPQTREQTTLGWSATPAYTCHKT